MARSKKCTEQLTHTVIIVDLYWLAAETHAYSVYVDNNLEIEGVEEVAEDSEIPLLFDLVGDPVEIKRIVVEDPGKLFQSELLYTMPEECADLWTTLEDCAVKVEKGVWRFNE